MIKPIPFIDLQAQKNRLNHKITNRVSDVLKHGQFIMGPEVVELEKKLEETKKELNNLLIKEL